MITDTPRSRLQADHDSDPDSTFPDDSGCAVGSVSLITAGLVFHLLPRGLAKNLAAKYARRAASLRARIHPVSQFDESTFVPKQISQGPLFEPETRPWT